MKFYGLFIGIDRYESPSIAWLSCAKKDAKALHALFSDSLGGSSKLLLDNEATKANIQQELLSLTACSDEDVVVIMYSGHGTETHELVTYDADIKDIVNTSISLEVLTEWFSKIPAKNLICILDCCFSGEMGSKVLKIDAKPKDPHSASHYLEQMSGEGRIILTASLPTEQAWETMRYGHGFLTWHLLNALQGAEEVRQNGKVSVFRLLEYVSQMVIDDTKRIGKDQHPTVKGTFIGELKWPIFMPGDLYRKAFPERAREPATADLGSLKSYGFPESLILEWAKHIPRLNQLQLDAINEYSILSGANILVSAPTSSGKTMIGELVALKGSLEGKRSIFLLPLKSLVNDKHQQFNKIYSTYGIKTIRATGESTDEVPDLIKGRYDICLMTYEKFAALILANPQILEQVSSVVIDEVQMIADKSRGTNLEFILTLLKIRSLEGASPQIIALSAVIGDTNGLERWLDARLLRREERPVPLEEGLIGTSGSFRFMDSKTFEEKNEADVIRVESAKNSSQDVIKPLAAKLINEGKQIIIFRETRGEARGCAKYLSDYLCLPPVEDVLDALPNGDLSLASRALRETVSKGVAFHISDLDREERMLIESIFRKPGSKLKVIVATTTLAMGINTPTEAVIIAGLQHPGSGPYSIAEYKNMVGRAGRLGFSQKGASYLIALNQKEESDYWRTYILGKPEDIESRFINPSSNLASIIIRIIVSTQKLTGRGAKSEEITKFLENSFGSFQKMQHFGSWKWDQDEIKASVHTLEDHVLIRKNTNLEYELTELGWITGQAGIEVESVIRIVDAFTGISSNEINDPALITAAQLSLEVDNINFPLNKKSINKEPTAWMSELRNQYVPAKLLRSLGSNVKDVTQTTSRAKKSVACLLWITDQPMFQIEETLTQFGGRDGAAGPLRSVSSRTADILPIVVKVVEVLNPGLDLSERRDRLTLRLEIGIPPGCLELSGYLGSRLTRSNYLILLNSGLTKFEALRNVEDSVLLTCLQGNQDKLELIREAQKKFFLEQIEPTTSSSILPAYES